MTGNRIHPAEVLFDGEQETPILPPVDHYAGAEKLIRKAMALQAELGPIFDITCDCEDGAAAGHEHKHAQMCARLIASQDNLHGRMGARIHDPRHPHWHRDLEILLGDAGNRIAFITLPKPLSAGDVARQIDALDTLRHRHGIAQAIRVHVLIETHGALRECWQIAAMPGVESLDFGLMDFVSAHRGAIPASAMRSPGQFEHPLIARAKTEIAAAALANGAVPSHNVTTELKDVDLIGSDARTARQSFGFLRMWSIHPNQILPIAAAMRADDEEIQIACRILALAQDAAWGPIRDQGRLHDRASYRYFWDLLARAERAGAKLDADTRSRFFELGTQTTVGA